MPMNYRYRKRLPVLPIPLPSADEHGKIRELLAGRSGGRSGRPMIEEPTSSDFV
jgi:hypothetical protein